MLSSEISTLLSGRIVEFNIYPFHFEESERYRNELGKNINNGFVDFLELGGYPFRFNLDSKEDVKLYDNICKKDIFSRDVEIEKNEV